MPSIPPSNCTWHTSTGVSTTARRFTTSSPSSRCSNSKAFRTRRVLAAPGSAASPFCLTIASTTDFRPPFRPPRSLQADSLLAFQGLLGYILTTFNRSAADGKRLLHCHPVQGERNEDVRCQPCGTARRPFGLLVCLCVNRAETQDPNLKPTFGKVDLKAGFPNDPYEVKLTAGG